VNVLEHVNAEYTKVSFTETDPTNVVVYFNPLVDLITVDPSIVGQRSGTFSWVLRDALCFHNPLSPEIGLGFHHRY